MLLQVALAIAWKDIRAELRSRQTIAAMLLFALLAILIFSFALELDRSARQAGASGVLWVTLIFAGTLGLGRSLNQEYDQGTLDGLLIAPVDRSALYFGKLISNFLFMLVIAVLLIAPLSVLFGVSFLHPLIPLVLIGGVLGYAGIGTLISSMAIYARGREVLMPILLLPLALSLLIPSVRATRGLLEGVAFSEVSRLFSLLAVINVIYITLAYLLFEFIVEE